MANSRPSRRPANRLPRAVALVGFMGAGKTTIGRALSERLGWEFLDLDDLIQARDGRPIQQIFQENGESAFRDLERQLLEETIPGLTSAGTVLSLGGGAFISNTNQDILRENEVSAVFLDAPAEELFRRCSQPGVIRPLLNNRSRFDALYEERRPAYLKAVVHIQTGGREITAILEEIISRLGLEKLGEFK